jgi:hypothetical protein
VQAWLDLVAGIARHSQWHRLVWRRGAGLRVDSADVTAAPGCEVCQFGSSGHDTQATGGSNARRVTGR